MKRGRAWDWRRFVALKMYAPSIATTVLCAHVVACNGDDEEDAHDPMTPAEACTHLLEICPGFPLSEDECVERADAGAPQSELDCVGSAANCREAVVDCLGYSEEQYQSIAAQGEMGGAGN